MTGATMHLNAAIVFLAVTAHGAAVAKPCDIAQSVLSKFKGAPAVTSVCNSLFGAPPSPTATVTKTTTKTVSPDKVTKLVTTTKTVTVTQKFTDLVLKTRTVFGGTSTYTDPFFVHTYTTTTLGYTNAKRDAVQARATPDPTISGVAKSALSTACSCLVPKPTGKTVTQTVTSTVTSGKPQTVKQTTTETETSYHDIYVKTRTITLTHTTYSYATVTTTSVVTHSHTTCSGTNPRSSFHMQISDTEPTKTDRFNAHFATQTPSEYVGGGAWTFEATPDKKDAALYNIDCIGRLVTKAVSKEHGLEDFYLSVSPYFAGFDVFYMWNQTYTLHTGFDFIKAEDRGDEPLYVYVDQEGIGRLDMLQTSELYKDEFELPYFIIANVVKDFAAAFKFIKVPAA